MDHTRHYLVAEMIHNALVPLRRANGFAVIEWNKMGQQAKDDEAREVAIKVNDAKLTPAMTDEEAIINGIIAAMFPVFPAAPLVATPQPTEPEKSSTPTEGNVIK